MPTPIPTPTPGTPIPPLRLTGRILYADPRSPNVLLPARGVLVELWDRVDPEECPSPIPPTPRPRPTPPISPPLSSLQEKIRCEDRLVLSTYTDSDGFYTFILDSSSPYLPIDAYLVIRATDNRRVEVWEVKEGGTPPFFPNVDMFYHRTDVIRQDLSSGYYTYNVEIRDEKKRNAFFIYDVLTRMGWEGLQQRVGWAPNARLTVYWPTACLFLPERMSIPNQLRELLRWIGIYLSGEVQVHSCAFFGSIFLTESDGSDPSIILHEFGHFVMDHFPGYQVNVPPFGPLPYTFLACARNGFNHDPNKHTSPSCAWSEGWASFLAAALLNDPMALDKDLETPRVEDGFPTRDVDHPTNADSEWAVGAALWDLYDDRSEPWDLYADGFDGPARNGLWTLTTQETPDQFEIAVEEIRLGPIPIPIPALVSIRDGVEAFWMAWAAHRPERLGEAACPMYRLDIILAANPTVSPIPYGLCPPGFQAAFFNDADDGQWTLNGPITWDTFTPPPVFQGTLPAIAFDTHAAPNQPVSGVQGTFWSARFQGWVLIPQDGTYRFFFDRLDDGGRLFLGDEPVFASWIVHGPRDEATGGLPLPAGLISLTVHYAQGPAFEASLFLRWEGPGVAKTLLTLIGASEGLPRPTPTPIGWDGRQPLREGRGTQTPPAPRPTYPPGR